MRKIIKLMYRCLSDVKLWAYMIILVVLVFFASSCEPLSAKETISMMIGFVFLMVLVFGAFGGLVYIVYRITRRQSFKDFEALNAKQPSDSSSTTDIFRLSMAAQARQRRRKLLIAGMVCLILAVLFPVATTVLAWIVGDAHNAPLRGFVMACWWISGTLSVALAIAGIALAISGSEPYKRIGPS